MMIPANRRICGEAEEYVVKRGRGARRRRDQVDACARRGAEAG